MAEQKDNTSVKKSSSEKTDKRTMLSGDSGPSRLQIFSAKADGGVDSIASFNPSQAPSSFKKKSELDDNDDSSAQIAPSLRAPKSTSKNVPDFVAKADKDTNAKEWNDTLSQETQSEAVKQTKQDRFSFKVTKNIVFILSCFWLGLCLYHALFSIGIVNLLTASLMEVGGLLGIALAPIALLWSMVSSLQRNDDIEIYAQSLKAELNSILFPSEERAQRVHRDIEDLVAQSSELAASSKAVLKSIHRARHGLRAEMKEFATLAKKGEHHISSLSTSLSQSVADAEGIVQSLEGRIANIENRCSDSIASWDKAVDTLLEKEKTVEAAFDSGAVKMLDTAKKMTSEATIIQNSFTDTASKMADKVSYAVEDLESVQAKLSDSVSSVETVTSELTDSHNTLSANLDDQVETLRGTTTEAAEMLSTSRALLSNEISAFDEGVEKITVKTEDATKSLNKRIAELLNAADKVNDSFDSFDARLEERAEGLTDSVSGLDRFLEKIDATGEDAIHRLSEALETALSSSENMRSSIHEATALMGKASDKAQEQADTLLNNTNVNLEKLGDKERDFIKHIEDYSNTVAESLARIERVQTRGEDIVTNIDTKAQSGATTLKDAVSVLENTLSSIDDRIQSSLNVVEQTTKDVLRTEESFDATFAKRTEDLIQANQKTVESTEAIRDMLKGQAQEIAILSGKITGNTQSATDRLQLQQKTFQDVVEDNLVILDKASDGLEKQYTQIDEYCTKTHTNFEKLGQISQQTFDVLQQNEDDLLAQFEKFDGLLQEKAEELTDTRMKTISDWRVLAESLDKTLQETLPKYENFIEKSNAVISEVKASSETVSTEAAQSIERFSDIKSVMDSTFDTVSERTSDIQVKLIEVNDKMLDSADLITTTIDKAVASADAAYHSFEDKSSDIHLAVDQANLKIAKVQESLTEQLSALSDHVGQSLVTIGSAEDSFVQAAQTIEERLGVAKTGFVELKSIVSTEADALGSITADTLNKTTQAVKEMASQGKALLNNSDHTLSALKKVSDSISIRVMEIDKQMNNAKESAAKYTGALKDEVKSITEVTHGSVDHITTSIATLRDRANEIKDTTKLLNTEIAGAGTQLRSHAKDLKIVSETAVLVSSEASTNFSEHTEHLKKASADAKEQVAKIKEAAAMFQRDHFLGSAKFLMESVHSLSVDIIRHVKGGNIDEKDMRAYERGDMTIFTKRLLEIGDKFPEAMVREKFSSDTEFRTYVQRYCRQFEELLEQAVSNDHGGIMSATFVSSDIGKVYLLLCKSVGRTPRGIVKH